MALVPDELWYNEIEYHIKWCDNAWKVSAYLPDDIPSGTNSVNGGSEGIVNFSKQEVIVGDVQRTISTSDPLKGDEYFREIYLRECDRLAETLYVLTIVVPSTALCL